MADCSFLVPPRRLAQLLVWPLLPSLFSCLHGSLLHPSPDCFVESLGSLAPQSRPATDFAGLRGAAIGRYLRPLTLSAPPSGVTSIEGIFLINLDYRRGRRNRCERALQDQGCQAQRISAVVGAQLPLQALQECGLRWTPSMAPTSSVAFPHGEQVRNVKPFAQAPFTYYLNSPNMGKGALGCLLSHLSILQAAYEAGLQRIWVLEDDFEFLHPKQTLEAVLAELDASVGPEGWDLLYTDPHMRAKANPLKPWICHRAPVRPDLRKAQSGQPTTRTALTASVETVNWRYGTCSLILNRSGIEKILRFYRDHGAYGPIDWDLHLVPELKQVACREFLVTNRVGQQSDIQQEGKSRGPHIEPGDDPQEVRAALGE